MTMQRRGVTGRLLRFGLTGMLATLMHSLIAIACVETALAGPAMANGIAFIGATLLSYVINTRWSFARPLQGRTLARFLLVSLIGFCTAMTVAGAVERAALNYLFGIAAVAMVVPLMTFFLHNFWTYKGS
ncbi:GtrA family protein [Stutzerimonas zhaodongensis]|uniref:GtrA family protein n=1 Tax=Stutzerimonas zhaodongensis TaxID=1176257 RepID=A0A365PT28_9GAMM|nr:GtrA family protein [Stutzerimonas zhaodongensis]